MWPIFILTHTHTNMFVFFFFISTVRESIPDSSLLYTAGNTNILIVLLEYAGSNLAADKTNTPLYFGVV
jgi:hypothetical protein